MKGVGMLVILLRGVNFGFWCHLGCSGQTPSCLAVKVSFRVAREKNVKILYCLCFNMVSFRGPKKFEPRPNWSPLGVLFQNFRQASPPLSYADPPPHPQKSTLEREDCSTKLLSKYSFSRHSHVVAHIYINSEDTIQTASIIKCFAVSTQCFSRPCFWLYRNCYIWCFLVLQIPLLNLGIIGADQLLSCCHNFKLFSKIMGIIIWLIQKRKRWKF